MPEKDPVGLIVLRTIESLSLSQRDAQFRNKWRGQLRGNQLTQVHVGKWPLKQSVCVSWLEIS